MLYNEVLNLLEDAITEKDLNKMKDVVELLKMNKYKEEKECKGKLIRGLSALSVFDSSNAINYLNEAYAIDDKNAAILNNLGFIYHKQFKNYNQSYKFYVECLRNEKKLPEAYLGMIDLLQELGPSEEERYKYIEMAVENCPEHAELLVIKALKEFDGIGAEGGKFIPFNEIVNIFKKAFECSKFDGTRGKIMLNLGHMYEAVGLYEKAIDFYIESIKYEQTHKGYQNILYTTHYYANINPSFEKILHYFNISSTKNINDDIKVLHEILCPKMFPILKQSSIDINLEKMNINEEKEEKEEEKKDEKLLRVGYVGGDFIDHVVSRFLQVIFKNKNTKFAYFVYSTNYYNKTQMAQFTENDINFRYIGVEDATKVAKIIINDRLDVLIDLAGHTAKNRLDVFAILKMTTNLKMYSFIGYPNNIGFLPRISDRYSENYKNLENVVCMDDIFLNYSKIRDFPLPMKMKGPTNRNDLIIGCFARLSKINDKVIETWNTILDKAQPFVKLILKSKYFADKDVKEMWTARFKKEHQNKLVLLNATKTYKEHLELFNLLDVHLDTFPYSGTTITMDALYMNVPVITVDIVGSHVNRVSGSILHSMGLDQYIATNINDYIEKVVHFNKNRRPIVIKDKSAQYIKNFEQILLSRI